MKRIWLTGASSGIGAALAEELLRAGHQLALSARTLAPLEDFAERYGDQVLVVPGDLGDPLQVHQIGNRIDRTWGALDCVILNAGTCEYIDVAHFEAAMVERVMRANLFSASHCIEAALPLLRRGKRPHLVGVGSSVTFLTLPRAGAYGASKAAMRYLLDSLRIDLADSGIDVTLVSPGFVDTPLTRRNDFPMPLRWSAQRAARHIATALERRPQEIAFPRLFVFALKRLNHLPASLRLAIGRRMARRTPAEDRS